MNILSVETSTRSLSLAVSKNEKVLRFRNVKLRRPLSASIMPSIGNILDAAGISLKQLDGFAVGLGPGSFTSLRVGLATVKGLAFATGKPVVGIPSLDLLAMNVPGNHARICTLCDAKRDLVYACSYEKKGLALKRKSGYLLAGITEVLKQIRGEVAFIGDGVKLYKDNIRKTKGIIPVLFDGTCVYPQARFLAPMALQRFRKGEQDDVDKLVPLYLYPDHCQIKNKK